MTMLAEVKETRALTLADYEARIHLYKEQIGTGYIGIGRTLIEAKDAKVVPHGQWETWVTETTGLTPRQAQRCMQAATEIRDGSAMAKLEMSKALMLLGSGLDEEAREEIAGKAADEGATVKALREEIKQAKLKLVQETGAGVEIREALRQAEAERQDLEQQLKDLEKGYQDRLEAAREDAYKRGEGAGKLDSAAKIRELEQNKKYLIDQIKMAGDRERELKCRMEDLKRVKPATVAPPDYEQLKRDRETILAAAEDAERRAADAEAELESLRASGAGQPDPVWKVLKVAMTRFMADCEMMPLDPAAMAADRQRIEANLTRLEKWADMMRIALAGVVPAEGAVE